MGAGNGSSERNRTQRGHQPQSNLASNPYAYTNGSFDVQENTPADPFDDDWLTAHNRPRWKGYSGLSRQGTAEVHSVGMIATRPDSVVSESDYPKVYVRSMLATQRGYPLYEPAPTDDLPLKARRKGLMLGDVGILGGTGSFIPFFNIFQPSEHPLNVDGVPDGFSPLSFDPSMVVQRTYNVSFCLTSPSMTFLRGESPSSQQSMNMEFQSRTLEGAVLFLPCGATSEDLLHLSTLQRYVEDNIFAWYTFLRRLNFVLKNGDVRVIIGTDKSSAWGQVFYTSGNGLTPEDFHVKLTTESTADGVSSSYECTGSCFQVHGGPEIGKPADLREPGDLSPDFCNQGLFIRTMNTLLGREYWDAFSAGADFQPRPSRPFTQSLRNIAMQLHQAFNMIRYSVKPYDATPNENLAADTSYNPGSCREPDPPRPDHPSNALGEYLLAKFPDARLVITNDHDWMNHVQQADMRMPDTSPPLLEHILISRPPLTRKGIVTLCGTSVS